MFLEGICLSMFFRGIQSDTFSPIKMNMIRNFFEVLSYIVFLYRIKMIVGFYFDRQFKSKPFNKVTGRTQHI